MTGRYRDMTTPVQRSRAARPPSPRSTRQPAIRYTAESEVYAVSRFSCRGCGVAPGKTGCHTSGTFWRRHPAFACRQRRLSGDGRCRSVLLRAEDFDPRFSCRSTEAIAQRQQGQAQALGNLEVGGIVERGSCDLAKAKIVTSRAESVRRGPPPGSSGRQRRILSGRWQE